MVRRIGIQERRARLGRRHHLTAGALADDVVQVARDLIGLHATDPASVFLAARARVRDLEVKTVQRALYDERTLIRILGMRRTMFVVPEDLVPAVRWGCTVEIAVRQRRRVVQLLQEAGIGDDDTGRWLGGAGGEGAPRGET